MSLGNFCRWMAEYAEGLEIDIFRIYSFDLFKMIK